MAKGPGAKKKKVKKNILSGIAHIQATFNNTIITISDKEGNVITWSSAGTQGFKGSRKVPLCCPDGCGRCRKKSDGAWPSVYRCLCQGAWGWKRIGPPIPPSGWPESSFHQGCHTHSSQRVSSSKTEARLAVADYTDFGVL
jgi:hypothetical protein